VNPEGLLAHQVRDAAHLLGVLRRNGAAFDASETGCHAAGTPILKMDGTVVPVETLQIGDVLIGPDSEPRTIVRLARGRQEMRKICPVNGDPFVVNADHVLTVVDSKTSVVSDISVRRWEEQLPTTKRLSKLLRRGVSSKAWGADGLFDPYLVGLYLGDGGSRNGLSANIHKPDHEILDYLQMAGAQIRSGSGGRCSYGNFMARHPLCNKLREWGLHGVLSVEKWIPREYLTASEAVRLELLAGIMDTDGSLCSGGFDYCSGSRQLLDDTVFLARSLGFAAYSTTRTARCQNNFEGAYYRAHVSGDCSRIPTRIHRKKAPVRRQIKSVLRTGFTVEHLSEDDYYGFNLAGPDGRFLMGDFTVTHNTGKTYSAMAVCRELNLKPLVVCPKAVKTSWKRVAEHLGGDCDVVNYEAVRTGRTPYGVLEDFRVTRKLQWDGTEKVVTQRRFVWNKEATPDIIIFDECHRMKNPGTLNSRVGVAATKQGFKSLWLSATAAENPAHMGALGFAIRLHGGMHEFRTFCQQFGVKFAGGIPTFVGGKPSLQKLHALLFPERGVRTLRDDIADFPESHIDVQLVDLDLPEMVDELYEYMDAALQRLSITQRDDKDPEHPLTQMLRARQKIELLKVPPLVSRVEDSIEEGMWPVVFVNFRETLEEIRMKLADKYPFAFIHGGQTESERQREVDSFQRGVTRGMIAILSAGGVGLSLHDTSGLRPRESFINLSYSAIDLIQALGRVWRAGGGRTEQRIIVAANTIEEKVAKAIRRKLNCIDTLNDGDLNPNRIL
jgi:hypothetical protein